MTDPDYDENERRRRKWLIIFLLFLAFLALGLVAVFFGLLGSSIPKLRAWGGGANRAGQQGDGGGSGMGGQPVNPFFTATSDGGLDRIGQLTGDGFSRKFGDDMLIPVQTNTATNITSLLDRHEETNGYDTAAGGIGGGMNDCREYGSPADLRTASISSGGGRICLKFKRAVVNVPANSSHTVNIGGTSYDICELDRTVSSCFDIPPLMGTSGHAFGLGGADTNEWTYERLLAKWHEVTMADPDAARPDTKNTEANDDKKEPEDTPRSRHIRGAEVMPGVTMESSLSPLCMDHTFYSWSRQGDLPQLAFDPSTSWDINPAGYMSIGLGCGRIIHDPPDFYQVIDGEAVPFNVTYEADATNGNKVAARVGAHDETRPTINHAMVDYLSYLGGTGADRASAVALDTFGHIYFAGETTSPEFGLNGARAAARTAPAVFVTKFRIADSKPVFITILGNKGPARALDIAVDSRGYTYICGENGDVNFAASNGIVSLNNGRGWDVFVARLDPNGAVRNAFSFGGSGDDRAYALALDPQTNVYLVGETASPDFPATDALGTKKGKADIFLARLNLNRRTVDYITTIGGTGQNVPFDLSLDSNGVYIAGMTTAPDFPLKQATQDKFGGGTGDGFLLKMDRSGRNLLFSTFLGGGGMDRANAVCAQPDGHVLVCGQTASPDYPLVSPLYPQYGGGMSDGFAARFTPEGPIDFATFIGGSDADRAMDIKADAEGRLQVGGTTASTNLPLQSAVQKMPGGGASDGFMMTIQPQPAEMAQSTYLGGGGDDVFCALAANGGTALHAAGFTTTTNLMLFRPFQSQYAGAVDALAAAIQVEPPPQIDLALVEGDSQPSGPSYDFYMARFEISNMLYLRFLNNAEANTNNWRGTNMFFDTQGNVWINPAHKKDRDEMFAVGKSRLSYNPDYPAGARYRLSSAVPAQSGAYSNHPIAGVSWYGAAKFCNWLTIASGRGWEECAYREGSNTFDWAPATSAATNWMRGIFTSAEREAWLSYKGFRLPMDGCEKPKDEQDYLKVPHGEFARFLNDAEASRQTTRGANMYFDGKGDVWLHPDMRTNRDEMFTIERSQLVYQPTNPPGARYSVTEEIPPYGGSYTRYPITGVSWFGALKYCNWLSLDHNVPHTQRGYREGIEQKDWAPATSDPDRWKDFKFTEREYRDWRELQGIHLPYGSATLPVAATALDEKQVGTNEWTNPFNEFYKAASWHGETNMPYAFGRATNMISDANYKRSGLFAWEDTTPHAYYDGTNRNAKYQTRTNENEYGIFDLSGNVEEWLNDPGYVRGPDRRASVGGSWKDDLPRVERRQYVAPHETETWRGFRVVTTVNALNVMRIRYRICLCGAGEGEGCGEKYTPPTEPPGNEGPEENPKYEEDPKKPPEEPTPPDEPAPPYPPEPPDKPEKPGPGKPEWPEESPSYL
jgi:formylglycine-generating enzyme required for sulfatase activity